MSEESGKYPERSCHRNCARKVSTHTEQNAPSREMEGSDLEVVFSVSFRIGSSETSHENCPQKYQGSVKHQDAGAKNTDFIGNFAEIKIDKI